MNTVVAPPTLALCTLKSKNSLNFFNNNRNPDYKIKAFVRFESAPSFKTNLQRCNCSTRPNSGPSSLSSGENDNRTILDAFFLGKALAEAVSERVESTVGELLSTIGRLQAEQQKQLQDFQEDVLERAKKAKEKAAREAMEAQGLAPRSPTLNTSTVDAVSWKNSDPDLTNEDPVKLDYNGSEVTEEFVETEYYKDLNCIDKQHHTTGTGFIEMESGKHFSLEPETSTDSHPSSKGNPATNDWIPSAANTETYVSEKPSRSET